MHGRKKTVQSETEKKILKEKADTYNILVTRVLAKKKIGDSTTESLNITEKILKNNPDFYCLWNYRRNILLNLHGDTLNLSEDETKNKVTSIDVSDQELQLVEDCIRRNPKSYGAWYHRKWIFDRFNVDTTKELELCSLLLKDDQRNFHCWNYRRYIIIESKYSIFNEFEYTTQKINENFSNYSAFHHRCVFIKLMPCVLDMQIHVTPTSTSASNEQNKTDSTKVVDEFQRMINEEFGIIENAIFTEPDDQSAWWYHQFLLSWLKSFLPIKRIDTQNNNTELTSSYLKFYATILFTQKSVVEGLLNLEVKNKWALVCLVNIYDNILTSLPIDILINCESKLSTTSTTTDSSSNSLQSQLTLLRSNTLEDLIEIDPSHSSRYKFMLNKFVS